MIVHPYTPEAEELLLRGQLALNRASYQGMPVDVAYCQSKRDELHLEMAGIQNEAWKLEPRWLRKFGSKASLGNDNQVREVLFDWLKLTPPSEREDGDEEGLDVVDKDAMSQIDHPLAGVVLRYRKARKTADTFLKNLIEESVDGVIHPWFHLHRVRTYRSSSSGPNFQNFPMRDPLQAAIIRRAFPAGKGWVIVEIDYKGVEVRVACCYHKDPRKIWEIEHDYDDHRDMAMECFILTEDEFNRCLPKPKMVRHVGKNGFVFPEYYGSVYFQVAPNMWRMMKDGKFTLADGTPFEQHLAQHGIRELGEIRHDPQTGRMLPPNPGTFLSHISQVEKRFWGERLPVYAAWKKWWYAQYQKRGWFKSKTGFHHEGVYKKNDVLNHPIQGDAFHCNLRSFYRLDEEMRRRNMQSYLGGQIHDSIIARVRVEELDEYLELANDITSRELMEAWKWLIVPIKVDVEASPEGGTWYDKKELKVT